MLGNIRDSYPVVFGKRPTNRQHCRKYQELSQQFGFTKIILDAAEGDYTKIKEIEEANLNQFLFWTTYCILKSEAEEAEMEFQDNQRKNKK
jgi:hypothetical protein